jgi:hypothetical protein
MNATPPSRIRRPLPLFTVAVVVACCLARAASAANRWEEMDYGPFLTSSVTMPGADPEDPAGIVEKGVTVRLGTKDQPAGVCFDTELLCYRAGWTGGWLKLMGTPFDGTHRPPEGSRPMPQGDMAFSTGSGPGWASPAGKWDDPRERPYGPLPRAWGKYKGMYVHGDKVVFAYTVNGTDVLDHPSLMRDGDTWQLRRTLHVGPSDKLLALECGTTPRGITQGGLVPGKVDFAVDKVWLEPSAEPRVALLVVTNSPSVSVTGDLDDPSTLTKGGPTRWPQTVVTKGTLGAGDGPYVVDTLTLPDDNPWKSWMRVGGFDFFKDGKSAALSTWSGDVWIVSGIDDQLEKLTWKRYAAGLFQPLGLKIVDEKIHVLGRDGITRLHDLNGDNEADFYEAFNHDVEATPNFHEFAFDLQTDAAGNFYFTKGAPLLGTHFWDPIGAHNGALLRVTRDGGKLDVVATGLRAPNGAGISPAGQLTCSDNQGIWTPVCRINWIREGGFYGAVGMHHSEKEPTTYDPPLCWLPFAVDNSSGGQVWVPDNDKWGPFAGHLLHLSYGKCDLFHVMHETPHGTPAQGGVVRFPIQFSSGIMRARFNPADGQLYVAGLKGWQTEAALDGCLQRVRYTGRPVHTAHTMTVTPTGVDITFTQPLDPELAADPESYAVERWNYLWSKEYGSPEFRVSDPAAQGRDPVTVTAATLSPDGRTVSLTLADHQPSMQLLTKCNLESADGTPVEIEIYSTINHVPAKP